MFVILFTLSTLYFRYLLYQPEATAAALTTWSVVMSHLRKRVAWVWAANAALGGFFVAAAALSGGYAVNACTKDLASPKCWISAAISVVCGALGGVGAAAAARGGAAAGSAAAAAKRDGTGLGAYIDTIGSTDYYQTTLNNLTTYEEMFNASGLTLLSAFTFINNNDTTLQKRSGNMTENLFHALYFSSDAHSHVATHLRNDVDALVKAIVTDENPGSLESTLRNSDNGSLGKYYNNFDAEWVSWSWDNANADLVNKVSRDRGLEEEEYDQGFYNYFGWAPAWKYCWTVTENPNVGQAEGWDQIGQDNAVHGELYFNTYGGVDGYCNDNRDGAQCSTPDCEM